jgi:tRNA A-37 threonylcarbamoyl transferase component Bud32
MQLGLQTWTDRTGNVDRMAATLASGSSASTSPIEPDLVAAFPQLEILHLIGQGGMGSVYCARQKGLDRLVALKIIKPESQKVQDFASRFVREAQALGHLNHPNIVTVHDFGRTGELYYFIMEFVDGINLRQMLFGGKLQPSQALAIVPAICDALQYAHDKGIVHRDIKPENILVDTEGKVKIADFGLAKLLNAETVAPALTQAHQVMGTMHYMAPEQFERPLDVDHRADIYSLGVVIYELLTGELPLGRFAPPSKKVTLDVRLDEIVLHTLEKEPELRYQKASEIRTDMQALAQAPPTAATPAWKNRPAPPVKQYHPEYPPVASPGPWPETGMLAAVIHPQTYKNWVYLLLSFPLGILYFVLMVTGLSTGIGTLIVWIGLPILLGTMLLARGFGSMERSLASSMLRTPMAPREISVDRGLAKIERGKRLFVDSRTWLSILYLIGKFPLGILSFVAAVLFAVLPISCFAAPALSQFWWFQIQIAGVEEKAAAFVLPLIGVLFLFTLTQVVNGLAWLHAGWAKLCLR